MAGRRRHRRNLDEPGHAHELTFSCYRSYRFLEADRTRAWLVESIDEARRELDFAVWAYVIMPEHVHVIVWPRQPEYETAAIRRAVKEPVGRRAVAHLEAEAPHWLARITVTKSGRERRRFWQQGGGYDRNIVDPATLEQMIEYIHLNPVRRGLVERARDWTWSSAAWFEGIGDSPLALDPIPPEWTFDGNA